MEPGPAEERRGSPARPSDQRGQGAPAVSWGDGAADLSIFAFGQGAPAVSADTVATDMPVRLAVMTRANDKARKRRG